jgi:hypothetical protein
LDAEAADESAPIVVVVDEAVGVAANLLGKHVDVLDTSVRCSAGVVVGDDEGLSAFQGWIVGRRVQSGLPA